MIGVFRDDDALLQERLKPPIQEKEPLSDKILANLLIASFLSLVAFIPLDVFRFHLFAPPKAISSVLGLLLFIIGWGIISLSFKVNTFAATAVKHQANLQQTVIDQGVGERCPTSHVCRCRSDDAWYVPVVRMALIAIVSTIILVIRIQFEDKFLRQELHGYDSYIQ
ncbi:hypothetical protein BV372_31330 [Nostoc sp. T09]|uniref:hypothetical protein n=1 Tax=Nostoc sp. T09 TaxID=1932621 RepID=UPI000A395B84|nr:hypothetical protein [Nostoc sp. T09]OUL21790.1 hypothetical protein BV372_31330 [Nostoc sp. T09]